MQTFLEFLHGDGWERPLTTPTEYEDLAKIAGSDHRGAFPDWQRDAWRATITLSPSQRLMLILAGAGQQGVPHGDLSAMLKLDGDTLNDLLGALVRGGEISVSTTRDGHRLYRRLI